MRSLKMVLVLMVVLALTVVVFVPLAWLRAVDSLPAALESKYDIELQLRQRIESERKAAQGGKFQQEKVSVAWPTPDFTHLPKDLVALYINALGCPNFFGTPQEQGFEWNKRLFNSLRGVGGSGNGRCELNVSRHLAELLGAKTTMEFGVAADRVHRFLKKDELIAFDLETMNFGGGVIGVHAAAKALMKKDLEELNLAELAEFYLVMPPYDLWAAVSTCQNAALIRTNRDGLLLQLRKSGLITADAEREAREQMPRCLVVNH